MRSTSTRTSTGKQLTLMACWAKGAHGAVLRGTQGNMCDMMSMAILLGILLLLLVWWRKDQGREQAGTSNGGGEGRWNKGLIDEQGKRERRQSIVRPQLFTPKDGDNLRAPLLVHPPYKTGAMSNSYMLVGDEISVTGDSPASTLKPDEEQKERGTGDDQGGDTAAGKGQDDSPVAPPGMDAATATTGHDAAHTDAQQDDDTDKSDAHRPVAGTDTPMDTGDKHDETNGMGRDVGEGSAATVTRTPAGTVTPTGLGGGGIPTVARASTGANT